MIEFIFEHLPFIIIVIGGLISFLGRKGEDYDTPTEPVKAFRTEHSGNETAGHQNGKDPAVKHIYPEKAKAIKPAVDVMKERSERELAERQEKLSQMKEELETRLSNIKNLNQLSGQKNETHSLEVPAVKHENVVEGIIWSETLGPPRAKNPYRPPNMKK